MSRIGRFTLLIVILFVVSRSACGQLSEADRTRLASEIEAAAGALDPSRLPDLESSKSQFISRLNEVRQYFNRATDAENRDAWLGYLNVDPLVEAIESEKSPSLVAREAVGLRHRLIGTSPGLELTALRRLRASVEQLIEAVRFRDQERSLASIERQLGALASRVRELDDSPSANDFAAISALTAVLDRSGQAESVVQSLRSTFSRPNVVVMVGEPMVQSVLYRNVNETQPVRDCILGTRIVGNATMNGNVTANLLPAMGSARINVTLLGHIVSNSTGYNGPVRLRTVGHGDVTATRVIHVNDAGISMEPVQATGVLRSEITSIQHHLKLVRNIACKRAAQQKPAAERIATQRMREKIGRQFTEQTDEAATSGTPEALAEIRPMLKRLSLEEPARHWSSTEDAMQIDSIFRRHDQLGAVVSRPTIGESYDAAIQIHESLIDNACAPVLAGRTVNESQINQLLEKSGRPATERPTDENGEPEPPFEIDFSRSRPIIFESRDQTLRVGVRGTRFAQGSRELRKPMEITAEYEPAKTEDGAAVLMRKGPVGVDFPGNRRLSVSEAGLRRTIQKSFSNVFPEIILDRPLEVPQDAEIESMRGRAFQPQLVDARDGWLTIAVRRR